MNIEELKKQAETEIADFIAQKIAELNKNTGKEVSEIRFTAREKMTGLESYDVGNFLRICHSRYNFRHCDES